MGRMFTDETSPGARLNALERQVEDLEESQQARVPDHPPGVVVYQDSARVSTDVSPRFRHLDFIGANVSRDGERAEIRMRGGGVFCFDYLVNKCWADEVTAGRGSEGDTINDGFGCSFKVYSTVQGAVDDAESRQASGDLNDSVAIAICAGRYSETVILGATGGIDSSNGMWLYGFGLTPAGGVGHTTGAVSIGIANSTVAAIDMQSGTPTYILENLNLDTLSGAATVGFSLEASGTNVSGEARNCQFGTKVGGDFSIFKFDNCEFQELGYTIPTGKTPATVTFNHCAFTGGNQMVWTGGAQQHYFDNCMFQGAATTILIDGGNNDNITFDNCDLSTGSTNKQFLTINGSGTTVGTIRFVGGCDMGSPGAAAVILIESPAIVRGLIVVGNTFEKVNNIVLPYISSTADAGDVSNCIFAGNSFGRDGVSEFYIETENAAKASIVGNFDESVFGPNAPATIVQYDITGSNNEFYPGTSATGSSTSVTGDSKIIDADGDTKVDVEESADEDRIRFDVEGSEVLVISSAGSWQIINDNNAANWATIGFEKSVSGGAVTANTPIGVIRADPHDGSDYDAGAQIIFQATENHDASSHGQKMTFYTVPNGSTTITLAMTIEPDQNVTLENGIYLKEKAEADADVAAYGQIWVDTQAPNALFFTDDAGADHNLSKPIRYISFTIGDKDTSLATGNSQAMQQIPAGMDGMNLVEVLAGLGVVGTTGTMTIQIRRSRETSPTAATDVDMLSTRITIDSIEFSSHNAAAAAVINGSNDDINKETDRIFIDIDGVHTTPGRLLDVTLGFQLP